MDTASAKDRTAKINDQLVTLRPRETLLDAALRSGVDFPNSCRVGGCGSCKCKLTEGAVKELTETGYLLSAKEIEEGYILACQSVAESDVRVEVDLAPSAAKRSVRGRVIAQEKVTHDIARLSVKLDEALAFHAGQYADLRFDALPEARRSYSFAAPPNDEGVVEFFVRKVPGGALSSFVNDRDVRGESLTIEGPNGDFWLRDGEEPVLMVAGGSGLAPILAMLEDAHAKGASRSVTLVFGAREERDLYALDRIEALARGWRGALRFVPVLSHERADSAWTGARGWVTDALASLIEPGASAYLCGPPAMIDATLSVLESNGVAMDRVRFDRFTTRADVAPKGSEALPPESVERSTAGALHYLKYFLFHAVGLSAVAALFAGGTFITVGLVALLAFYVLGDAVSGDDVSTPKFRYPAILTAQLWLALPLLALIVFASVWSVSTSDPLGIGAWLSSLTGVDLLAARAATTTGQHVAGWALTGLMIGMIGTIPAHELTHRTWDPVSMLIGRWLLAFSFDASFAIEHVYGHHRYVSTTEDPATAPRGRNVYFHVIASTIKGNVSAWKIEAARLAKRKLPVFSLRNAVLRGYAMSVALVAIAAAIGGLTGAAYFVACALWGKALLEIVNYMEHYGMVRNPSLPVQPRHSWNTNRRLSSWTMFNLTRHSHHHAQGEVAYQDLRPYPDAPMMIGGYLTTLVVAMIPPLWHALMTPKVLAWDRDYASDEERTLARSANEKSGISAFSDARAPQPRAATT
ncbi:MAG: fatty acid desaturase [Polyangiales bacterium]